MAGPTDLEQLLLEYIDEARIDPRGDAARFIASYSPLQSNDPNIQAALNAFGVSATQLLSQLSALTPTQPLAWNDNLAAAATQHSVAMIAANTQSGQLPGEASPVQRDAAAGYTNASSLGENVLAATTSPLAAQGALLVDWGAGPGGILSPPSDRNNIMSSSFRQVGIGIAQTTTTANVGPLTVTEDFGSQANSGAYILGVAYNDTDHNNFYSVGEGLGNLVVTLDGVSTTSWASGGYTVNATSFGQQTITFTGAGLSGPVNATVMLTATSNDMFDVVNGNTLETAVSASLSGAIATIEGLGATGLTLSIADAAAHSIIGTKGNDTLIGGPGNDTMTGGGGNDLLIGGGGVNWAVFSGVRSAYSVIQSGGAVTVSGADGVDVLTGMSFLEFSDTVVALGGSGGKLIPLGSTPQTVTGSIGDTIIGGAGTAVVNATAGAISVVGGKGAMSVFGGVADTVTGGSGPLYVDGSIGHMSIAAGLAGGNNTIVGSVSRATGVAVDTLTGGSASVLIQGLGAGDIVNFAGQTGNAFINATAGNNAVTLGGGFAAVYGGPGDTVTMGTGNQVATGFSGGTEIIAGSAGTDSMIGSVARAAGLGPDTLIGGPAAVIVQGLGPGDIVLFGNQTGTAAINATAGTDSITLGMGAASVFGGIGNTILFGSGNQYADGLTGGTTLTIGTAGGSDTIVGSAFAASGAAADTLLGGGASVLVEGLGPGDVVNFAGQSGSAAINATAGRNAITLGSGAASVFGGLGGTMVLGTGAQLATQLTGGGAITVGGVGGSDTIVGSVFASAGAAVDTLTGGAAAVVVSGVGKGDIINFAGQTGTAVINALGGANPVTLGIGAATVFGGVGDTISLGSGNQYVDTSFAPGAVIKLGSAGNDNIIGSAVAGVGATIKGGAAALIYNAGGGSDLLDLTGASGTAVINGFGTDTGSRADTIIAGNGGTTVFGGSGNRIGVGTSASGTDQFFHSTTIAGAAVGFGTSGSAANSSTAQVSVTGFAETGGNATDFIFYQNENAGANTAIITGSTQTMIGGAASTVLTLPDGTVMTLVGIAKADFNTNFFR